MREITYEELKSLPKDSYQLIDIRDEGLTLYGMIPGAVNIYVENLENSSDIEAIPRDKKLVFYCEVGRMSLEIDDTAEYLEGRDCYSLSEGYVGYIRAANMEEMEMSIIVHHVKQILFLSQILILKIVLKNVSIITFIIY